MRSRSQPQTASPSSQRSLSNLTDKQAKILAYIEKQIARLGRPPTYRDIAEYCGYDAVGTVQDHLKALIQKGFLQRDPGQARGLRLTSALNIPNMTSVPILGVVPAGRPIEAIEDRKGDLAIPPHLKGEMFALQVRGDSMIDAGIFEGDYVIVRKQQDASDGDIVVAMIDGEATVKTLERKHGRIQLLPANPRYTPIQIPAHAENVIQGKVVSVQRFY